MMTLGERLQAAMKGVGKTVGQLADEVDVTREHLSRIIHGENQNPSYQLLLRLARATNTTLGALNGESIDISPQDEHTLTRFRDWVDGKLATIDALSEPNAVIIPELELTVRESRVADRKQRALQTNATPFPDATLFLRAMGDSMRGAGILPGDTLYATTRRRNAMTSALDRIIACRIGDATFVKRLTSHRRRHFLLSAHPRYKAIDIDPDDPRFEILGVVIGRSGSVG